MINLQPFTSTDFARLIRWADSEEMLMQFAGPQFTFPLTKAQLDLYLEDKNRYAFKVIYKDDDLVIGHSEIYSIDAQTALLCRILIGDTLYRGKGIGQMVTRKLLDFSFKELGKEKAALNVFDWNLPAIKCYEKAGFIINHGKIRNWEVNGKTWTALNMELYKERWMQLYSS